jgi:hypothetical protein
MFKKIIQNKLLLLDLLVIVFLIILPYYLFSGKLYIGGDDTRLFYSYPLEFLRNITYSSWVNNSSIGTNGPSQYIAPFLLACSFLGLIISKITMNYLAFSLPLILGFIYFQRTIKELFNFDNKTDLEILIGSIFYILSPILIIDQMFVFLISIWLVGFIPIIIYYFLKYLKTKSFTYVFVASIWCLVLGHAIYSIPWLVGFIFPVALGLTMICFLFPKKDVLCFLKRLFIFLGFIIVTQAFWLISFISTYLNLGQNSFASKFLSKGFIDTFTPTILSTATSTVIYPLLNLFPKQIVFDFDWRFKDVFTNFYDKTFILNLIFILILGLTLLNYRRYLDKTQRKIFLLLLVSFIVSLYFFTVNIGPLKDLFILFGHIPGFTMFRNFYDKFAVGYVLIYAAIITVSLIIFSAKYPIRRKLILPVIFLIIIINFLPVKQIVNSPLWMTKDIHKNINIPKEYLDFMSLIKNNISSTNNILSIPFGSSIYSIIKDENSNNVYAGVSPVKIFSGVNDISGHMSFNFTKEADIVDRLIVSRKYEEFRKVMFEHNINYILITKNVPKELAGSYLYNQNLFDAQDDNFINSITSKKLFVSSSGNYELYEAKKVNSLIDSRNIYFKKISQVEFVLYFKNLSTTQALSFVDSYHSGWKLFLQKNPSFSFCQNPLKNNKIGSSECKAENEFFNIKDLSYSFEKPIFDPSHSLEYGYANKWKVDPQFIKSNFDNNYFKLNKDGSIDVEFVLYFVPQNYFYFGIMVSVISFVAGGAFIVLKRKRKRKRKKNE